MLKPIAVYRVQIVYLCLYFLQQFQVKINRLSDLEMEFDLIGVDASIANAFRRILLAEVRMHESMLIN
jgi:hypothetical protein